MPRNEPRWWYATDGSGTWIRSVLSPAAHVYGRLAVRRLARVTPYTSLLPVICAGNFTAGGTGKTPLALVLAEELRRMGENPAILTRGYGGRLSGPLWIDPCRHSAREVGDEPLLLAGTAPVMIARDRRAGALAVEASLRDITAIVMDDGLQNPALRKDLKIALVDGRRGVGNGDVIPAGPLRAPLDVQLGLVDCVIVNRGVALSEGELPIEARLKRNFQGPVLAARVEPAGPSGLLADAPVVAYAGIANPERFFSLLDSLGARILERRVFPDHHAFTAREASELLAAAEAREARLVTTEKDFVRLKGGEGALAALREASQTVPIRLAFDERNLERLRALLEAALKTARQPARQG